MDVLLLTENLMGSSRIAGVLRGHGLEVQVAKQLPAERPEALRAVVVDLQVQVDLVELGRQVKDSGAQRLAFGPHVDEARLQAAAEAGWQVLSNGQFFSSLPQLAAMWAAPGADN